MTRRQFINDPDHFVHETELKLRHGDGVLVFVNGMGATYPLELSVCFGEVHRALGELGAAAIRSLAGTHLTSFDMAGCR